MGKKNIHSLAVKLIDSLGVLKASNTEHKSANFLEVQKAFGALEQSLAEELQGTNRGLVALEQLKIALHQFANTLNFETLAKATEFVQEILSTLQINVPETIFLLTAPFDEEAKTGDGQYALSLVEGFAKYSSSKCIWLKLHDGHYFIPSPNNLTPIPANTIPSVYALQPVANGHTVITGYQCVNSSATDKALNVISEEITLRTPKILLDNEGRLLFIGYQGRENKIILGFHEVQEHLNVALQHRTLVLQKAAAFTSKIITETITVLNQFKKKLHTELNNERRDEVIIEKLFKEMLEYSAKRGIASELKVADLLESDKPMAFLNQIVKAWTLMQKRVIGIEIEIDEADKAVEFLQQLGAAFGNPYHEETLMKLVNQLSGIRENYYDLERREIRMQTASRPNVAQEFYKALEVAEKDKNRVFIIKYLTSTMLKLGGKQKKAIDIHIRPPDTGAFIMPADIVMFQNAGIRVNVTIHEYKQNYTRRHLQKMTHDLLMRADSVLFFNEKDRHNAIKASQSGDLDYARRLQGLWPVQRYNLEGKAGLTVASQVLSGKPPAPELVIQKRPNILCFGTIRRGKGFEEALTIARELKRWANNLLGVVFIAGDPQDSRLMHDLFRERYGQLALEEYQQLHPYNLTTNQGKAKRDYWKQAKEHLERNPQKHNLYLELHPWCEPYELDALKENSKYVCRMDDMGMRNNGSAIISVLDVGVVYTKWGCVTDAEYIPEGENRAQGQYGNAVDLGTRKYGINQDKKGWDAQERIETPYKRAENSRDPVDILRSILQREEDQLAATDITQSKNYKTVVEAQNLLAERFTLKNGVFNLQQAFIAENETVPATLEQIGTASPRSSINSDRYSGLAELGDYARERSFFGQWQLGRQMQNALALKKPVPDELAVHGEILHPIVL